MPRYRQDIASIQPFIKIVALRAGYFMSALRFQNFVAARTRTRFNFSPVDISRAYCALECKLGSNEQERVAGGVDSVRYGSAAIEREMACSESGIEFEGSTPSWGEKFYTPGRARVCTYERLVLRLHMAAGAGSLARASSAVTLCRDRDNRVGCHLCNDTRLVSREP
ncbi:hypothetical protein EVAR_11014_1 [Eumeta japonica]|uniref:Uncharacterized protein n=1 Tax=Eumeta variegata TaxID=151549 RepID=A0A4C1YLZ0_EUMVA|nr:hypothetical protein EVAR_11014_1 [Eumeta japonica]